MTMAANVYKTQTWTPDKAIVELLIAGFFSQLKGWWDYHLTETDHLHILNSIQTYEDQTPILDPSGNTIQDAVSTLILTISLHFVGDPSHLKDKNGWAWVSLKYFFFNVALWAAGYQSSHRHYHLQGKQEELSSQTSGLGQDRFRVFSLYNSLYDL